MMPTPISENYSSIDPIDEDPSTLIVKIAVSSIPVNIDVFTFSWAYVHYVSKYFMV